MITFNQTPGFDNELIWVLQIFFDDVTLKLAYKRSITLSSNLYDSDVIARGSLDIGETSINPAMGGMSDISTLDFSFSRKSSNEYVDGFIGDFVPSTGGRYAVNRLVRIGVVWVGATNENQITWINDYYYIQEMKSNKDYISFQCAELSALEKTELPYYTIQNTFNNVMSYSNSCPDNNNVALPILYGKFNTQTFIKYLPTADINLAPAVLIDRDTLEYVYASHQCEAFTGDGYVYASRPLVEFREGGWLIVLPAQEGIVKNYIREGITLQSTKTEDETLIGKLYYNRGYIAGKKSDYGVIAPVNTGEGSITIADLETVSVKIDGSLNSTIGLPGLSATDVRILPTFVDNGAADEHIAVNYYDPATDVTSSPVVTTTQGSYIDIGSDISGKNPATLPWTFDQLTQIEILITNVTSQLEAAPKSVYLESITIEVNNIIVQQVAPAQFAGNFAAAIRANIKASRLTSGNLIIKGIRI